MESVLIYRYQPAAHLRVTDEDAADFLQSQFSNDLRPFTSGRVTYGLWLDVKGKVIADSYVLCEGDESFRVFSEWSAGSAIQDQLERHIIADEVEIESETVVQCFALVGDLKDAFWAGLGLEVPAAGKFVIGAGLVIFPGRRAEASSFEVICTDADGLARFESAIGSIETETIDCSVMERLRIQAGVPKVPVELGPEDLPGEADLVRKGGISMNKGCYLGQEVVARMHNIGRPQRGLFVLQGLGGGLPACPVELSNTDGKVVGTLRNAVSTDSGWIGVAMLKVRFASVGDCLLCGDQSVRVERPL